MFLYPIGRDDSEIRRHAWVSYSIIALNVLAFIASFAVILSRDAAPLEAKWNEVVEHLSQHPYLVPPAALTPMLAPDDLRLLAEAREHYRRNGGIEAAARVAERRDQRILDDLTAELISALRETPFHKYGYIPADREFLRLFTSMFLHGDVWHLLGNLLFFFATAPFIEDVFGRPLFSVLYFAGGIAATLTHAAHEPMSAVPLIGASGAIAAVMGAYLVRFTTSRIEFLWIPIIILPKIHARFFIPAFVVLPLWFAVQFFMASRASLTSGVAFWAHVGGFVFGLLFALAMRALSIEQRFIEPAIHSQTMWKQNPHLLRASEARQVGDFETARREIETVLRTEPTHVDACRAAWDLAVESRDDRSMARHASTLLDALIIAKEPDLAREHIDEALDTRNFVGSERFFMRAAQFMEKRGDRAAAIRLYRSIIAGWPEGASAFRALMQIGRLQRLEGLLDEARISLRAAQSHTSCTPDDHRLVDQQIAALPAEKMPWD